jgi:FkbM family methyltransferase
VLKPFRRWIFGPRVRISNNFGLVRLGSKYGGWTFVDRDELFGATIVSCGLGEDASFDIEFANRYKANVVIVDPTPRAIVHFQSIQRGIGNIKTIPYVLGGLQIVESYELSALDANQLRLIPKALTEHNGIVRFYEPPNSKDVSYSVINFQNGYSDSSAFIEVESIDAESLFHELAISTLPLLKLDIEGSEIEVIPMILKSGITPTQILVEFDELNFPSRRSRVRFKITHSLLVSAGYEVTSFDGRSSFSYIRKIS